MMGRGICLVFLFLTVLVVACVCMYWCRLQYFLCVCVHSSVLSLCSWLFLHPQVFVFDYVPCVF
jgi:hypothetical protein